MSLPCGDAPAYLIKTKICRVGVPRNVINYAKFEVSWLRTLSLAVCRSYPISTERITTINNWQSTVVLAVDTEHWLYYGQLQTI